MYESALFYFMFKIVSLPKYLQDFCEIRAKNIVASIANRKQHNLEHNWCSLNLFIATRYFSVKTWQILKKIAVRLVCWEVFNPFVPYKDRAIDVLRTPLQKDCTIKVMLPLSAFLNVNDLKFWPSQVFEQVMCERVNLLQEQNVNFWRFIAFFASV